MQVNGENNQFIEILYSELFLFFLEFRTWPYRRYKVVSKASLTIGIPERGPEPSCFGNG